jgi:hypothetical protein
MPDWQRLVREKMARLRLAPSQQDEVVTELASHLEEMYEEQRASGVAEAQAAAGAMRTIGDWKKLQRRVRRAKGAEEIMNNRTKQLWLPGMAAFWATMACEAALGKLGDGAISGGHFFNPLNTALSYSVWLVSQLLCGALAAYLSRRAGGTRLTCVGAALFTSAILLTTMAIVITICAIGRATGLAFTTLDFMLLIKPVVMVVLVPSIAMLLGALPFLSQTDRMAVAR